MPDAPAVLPVTFELVRTGEYFGSLAPDSRLTLRHESALAQTAIHFRYKLPLPNDITPEAIEIAKAYLDWREKNDLRGSLTADVLMPLRGAAPELTPELREKGYRAVSHAIYPTLTKDTRTERFNLTPPKHALPLVLPPGDGRFMMAVNGQYRGRSGFALGATPDRAEAIASYVEQLGWPEEIAKQEASRLYIPAFQEHAKQEASEERGEFSLVARVSGVASGDGASGVDADCAPVPWAGGIGLLVARRPRAERAPPETPLIGAGNEVAAALFGA